jgi:type III secretion protein U
MSETSEEKSEPASDKKIRDARKKGQVQRSQDFVSALVLLGCSLYLLTLPAYVKAQFTALVDLAATIQAEPFDIVLARMAALATTFMANITLPLVAIIVAAVIIGNVLVMGGFVFAMDPIKPDFNKINPAKGLERIFSFRGIIEFLKMVFKVVAVAFVLLLILRGGIGSLVQAPSCGGPCMQSAFFALLRPLMIVAVMAFGVLGLVDILLQRWLFKRDQRMTKTETKRERKETGGDPLLLKERDRQRREAASSQVKPGLNRATILIAAVGGDVVGIRYKRGETSVPFVVCRARAQNSDRMLREGSALGIPIHQDADLARAIARRGRPGDAVPEACFQAVADILVGYRLL